MWSTIARMFEAIGTTADGAATYIAADKHNHYSD
jgi:hypothetical protein